MNVKKAFNAVPKDERFVIGDNYFVLLAWTSDSGHRSGPYLVSVDGDRAIEVSYEGAFVKSYPASSDGYSPWLVRGKVNKKEFLSKMLHQLIRMVAS